MLLRLNWKFGYHTSTWVWALGSEVSCRGYIYINYIVGYSIIGGQVAVQLLLLLHICIYPYIYIIYRAPIYAYMAMGRSRYLYHIYIWHLLLLRAVLQHWIQPIKCSLTCRGIIGKWVDCCFWSIHLRDATWRWNRCRLLLECGIHRLSQASHRRSNLQNLTFYPPHWKILKLKNKPRIDAWIWNAFSTKLKLLFDLMPKALNSI